MRMVSLAALALFVVLSLAIGGESPLPDQAVSQDALTASVAITQLRARGPDGLAQLLDHFRQHTQEPVDDPALRRRLYDAIDAVAAQRDARLSGLYWYTDLQEAKRAAQIAGKPIISLRLLGRLDTDLSCANSRFFRTVLYANQQVSALMREQFILHWQSVRPVPVVTIDFGDGRTIRRTITGNSVHYVLTPDGRPIDAVPGLYGPAAFLRQLDAARQLVHDYQAQRTAQRMQRFLKTHHAASGEAVRAAWAADLAQIGREPNATDDQAWTRIAQLRASDASLDPSSTMMIRAKAPAAEVATKLTRSKARVEDPLLRIVRNLERSIAEDTVRNEYVLHATIHQWFADGTAPAELDALNEKVYAELFLTPSSDPWLGLVPADAYAALEEGD